MVGRWALAVWVTLLIPSAVGAQQAALGQDSMSVLGARAGSLAAREHGVVTRFWVGFVGGLPIGFFAPLSFGAVPLAAPALGGAGLVWVAADGGDPAPDPSVQPTERGLDYQRAFVASYTATLTHRRRKSALWGAAAGTGVGLGMLYWALSALNVD